MKSRKLTKLSQETLGNRRDIEKFLLSASLHLDNGLSALGMMGISREKAEKAVEAELRLIGAVPRKRFAQLPQLFALHHDSVNPAGTATARKPAAIRTGAGLRRHAIVLNSPRLALNSRMNDTDIPGVSGESDPTTPDEALPGTPSGRDKHGRFAKGAPSANPKGRPTESHEMKELARDKSKEAIARLVFWMRSNDPTASIAAAKELLSRGFGRPEQGITLDATVSRAGPFAGEVLTVTDPIEASRAYAEIIRGSRDPHSVEFVSAHKPGLVAPHAPPVRPALVPPPHPISRARPPETVQAPCSPEPRTSDQEYLPADEPAPSGMSKKTLQLWEKLGRPANPEEGIAALDAVLRNQRKPYIVT